MSFKEITAYVLCAALGAFFWECFVWLNEGGLT